MTGDFLNVDKIILEESRAWERGKQDAAPWRPWRRRYRAFELYDERGLRWIYSCGFYWVLGQEEKLGSYWDY